jgi:hypothetical protein
LGFFISGASGFDDSSPGENFCEPIHKKKEFCNKKIFKKKINIKANQ